MPRHVGYLWYCKNKFPNGIPSVAEVTVAPHIRDLTFDVKQVASTGFDDKDFASQVREAITRAAEGRKKIVGESSFNSIKRSNWTFGKTEGYAFVWIHCFINLAVKFEHSDFRPDNCNK